MKDGAAFDLFHWRSASPFPKIRATSGFRPQPLICPARASLSSLLCGVGAEGRAARPTEEGDSRLIHRIRESGFFLCFLISLRLVPPKEEAMKGGQFVV